MMSQPKQKSAVSSYDSGYEHSAEHWLATRRLVEKEEPELRASHTDESERKSNEKQKFSGAWKRAV